MRYFQTCIRFTGPAVCISPPPPPFTCLYRLPSTPSPFPPLRPRRPSIRGCHVPPIRSERGSCNQIVLPCRNHASQLSPACDILAGKRNAKHEPLPGFLPTRSGSVQPLTERPSDLWWLGDVYLVGRVSGFRKGCTRQHALTVCSASWLCY